MTTLLKLKLTPCEVRPILEDVKEEPRFGVYSVLGENHMNTFAMFYSSVTAHEVAKRVNAYEPMMADLSLTSELLRDLLARYENGTTTKLLIHKRLLSIETTMKKFNGS